MLEYTDRFVDRHIGPTADEISQMLKTLGLTLDQLMSSIVPEQIRLQKNLQLPKSKSEFEAIQTIKEIANKNHIWRSWLGMGYSGTITPPVIQRNILENPGWYTQYTPYQAEISQGRLEALINFQTMISDLTQLPVANASLLDEATACAEAMALSFASHGKDLNLGFFVSKNCHPQNIEVLQTRAEPLGIKIVIGDEFQPDLNFSNYFGVLVQYPTTDGNVFDYQDLGHRIHKAGAHFIVAADILSLCLLKPPGEFGADIAVGSTQRFGVPMGYGGPHAAYMSVKDDLKRMIPGRIIGISVDTHGQPASRLALQTREQHIRREKATSNICTAQVLLAVISSMYAVYHGPEGLQKIAMRVHSWTELLKVGLKDLGFGVNRESTFDTLRVYVSRQIKTDILKRASEKKVNLRVYEDLSLGISLDETVSDKDILDLLDIFGSAVGRSVNSIDYLYKHLNVEVSKTLSRKTKFLEHPVFNTHHSETNLLRYMHSLETKDLSLNTSMIALGSCTMKLNATAEMIPITWPEFNQLHPFVPLEQTQGYQILFSQLETWLAEITGFQGVSLQPNAGSQGEFAGLLAIRKYHQSRGESHRDICLIPKSAHGTNPASAVMAGMNVVVVNCDDLGNIDLKDLKEKADEHRKNLAAIMVTYPSTHGVFEESITQLCEIIHHNGGQVYMDGANMNAQVGLCRPGDFGPDVCHLNLHKTFCIPHGGGGPGMGPICVKSHLIPFLPGHGVVKSTSSDGVGAISAAPWGSASILPISWAYILMMGADGLKRATEVSILNANYMAKKLDPYFPVLYKGKNGFVAHECIVDLRKFKASSGIEVEDVAKRLMDYGFHAPTVSFPVAGTMMIEPTESESKAEMDRFCDTMISIYNEIKEIEDGKSDRNDNVLKNAPHTASHLMSSDWSHKYSRDKAAFPLEFVRKNKFWPSVGRINGVLGDRNLVCTCATIEAYSG